MTQDHYTSYYTSESIDSEGWDVYSETIRGRGGEPIDGSQRFVMHCKDESTAHKSANALYAQANWATGTGKATKQVRVAVSFLERRTEVHVLDEAPDNWEDMSQREQADYLAAQSYEDTLARVDYDGVDDEEYRIETLD